MYMYMYIHILRDSGEQEGGEGCRDEVDLGRWCES